LIVIPKRKASSPSSSASATTKPKKPTPEQEEQLRYANEKMRDYHERRPSLDVLAKARKNNRSKYRDSEHTMQLGVVVSLMTVFLITPLLGRKFAQDEEFRKKYLPSWYDFTLKKPKSEWSREELHEKIVEMQRDLHERAIRGEFSKEKLEKMRRRFAGVDPDDDEHGWGKLHPGVEDDEDVED